MLWLHSSIGYVLQTPHLFSGTVRENIRYGRLDATDAEIEEAAKLVSAHEIILHRENGYDSNVGEGGDRLSTGEKQLISFARAVLANPRIFVLDEATSSIDTKTEEHIQTAISTLLQNRTSFLICPPAFHHSQSRSHSGRAKRPDCGTGLAPRVAGKRRLLPRSI